MKLNKIYIAILFIFFSLQYAFWYGFSENTLLSGTRFVKPNITIVPNVPSETEVNILSLGDKQLYFRLLALKIQNAGDYYGEFTSVNNYDFNKLYRWFKILDGLYNESNFVPSLASYIYSNARDKENLRYLVKYLEEFSQYNLTKNWWWLSQAVYIANFKMKDVDLALDMSYNLSKVEGDIPMWARQMPAILLLSKGEEEASFKIVKSILDNIDSIDERDAGFLLFFIKERLKKSNFDKSIIDNKLID